MPLDAKGPGFIRRTLRFRKYSKLTRPTRIATLLITVVALTTAIAFSVSVNSRAGGWLWKSQPSSPSKAGEPTKDSTSSSASASAHRPLGPNAALLTPPSTTVTASKVDSLDTDVDNDGKADPGDRLKYTVTIGATGADATGVTFTDTVDPNTTFVGGSLAASPVATNDTFPVTVAGNIRINSATLTTPFSVVSNDFLGVNPTSTISAFDATTANGGQISMTTSGPDMGKFTYNPPAGFEGVDTFTYTLSDNANVPSASSNRTATVSITVSGMIWFINNNSAACTTLAAGCGRLTNPFSSLAAFDALNGTAGTNNPKANDNIFVYESATDYVGPVTLENGQKFIGQDATASLSSITGITPPVGSDALPTTSPGAPIVNITSAGNGINVAQNNTLRGFTGGNSAVDINGSTIGTLNVSDVTLNGNGGALNLSTGTLNGTFGSISSTNSATTGISLNSIGGSLTTGSTTVTNSTGIGISASNSSATLSFAATSVTGSGDTGISLTTNTGAITFGALTITPDSTKRGLLATDNTQTITIPSGTVTTSGAGSTAVEITRASGTTPLSVSLTTVSASGGTRGIMLSNTSGSFTVTGTGGTCTNANTAGCTGGTIASSTGADDSSATPVGTGVVLNNATNVSLTRMFIHDHSNYGIRGTSITGFTLDNSVLNGTNGTDAAASAASPFNEGSIKIDNLAGSATISNTFVSGGISNNVRIDNTSATVNRVTFTNDTIGANSTNNGEDGIQLQSENTGRILATIQNTTFTSARGDLFNFIDNATSGSADDLIFNNNTLSNNHPAIATGGGGVTISSNGTKDFTFHMESNTMRDAVGHAVLLVKSTGSASYSGTFTGNTIGVAATANSGSKEGSDLKVQSAGQGTVTVAITNNQLHQYNNNGIELLTGGGATAQSGDFNATITGNLVDTPGNDAGTIAIPKNGIHLNGGTVPGDTYAICAQIGGAGALQNSIATSGKDAVPATIGDLDFRLRQRQSTTVRLPGYGGANSDNTAVQNFVIANNSGNGAPVGLAQNTVPTGGGFVGGAACASPTTGPITAGSTSSLSTESVRKGVQSGVDRGEGALFAAKGENTDAQHVMRLSESEVSIMAQAAIARWADAGLSATTIAKLQSLSFEVADLPAGQLATATSSKITLDETAAGYGWFFDTTPSDDSEFEVPVQDKERQTTEMSLANGRMDLLTVLMREIGSEITPGKAGFQGSAAWLMQGTLSTDTRRAPAFKVSEVGKLQSAPASVAKQARTTTANVENQQIASARAPRNSRVLRNHAMRAAAPMSVADVLLNIGNLPAGKSTIVVFKVDVNDPFTGAGAEVCNQGTVSGSNFANVLTDDPSVGGAADPTCTPIDLQADLAVTKDDSPDPVIAGNNITYTINFVNNGPNAAGATVTDATPVGTTFVSASVQTGTGWGTTQPAVGGTGNVVFSKALVAKDETAVFQIVVKVNSSVAGGSTINNSATAATTGATDPVPGNNTGTASTSVIAQADLSITKTDGATTEIPGTSISYTITVNNSGPSDANGVAVADTFPSDLTGITFTSVAAGGATGNTAAGSGNISDTVNMPTGSSITYTVNATIKSSATGTLSNTATVTAPVGVTDPNTANNSATDSDTLVPTADLSITKTDGVTSKVPGTSLTYTIVVSNSGPSDAPGTAVADTFPGTLTGVTFTSVAAGGATGNTASGSGNISDTLSLPSGSSVTYTVNATVSASATGSLSNTATVTADAGVTDPTPGNNSATDTDTLTPQADLSITKTDGLTSAVPGATTITYTITVTNNGPSDAPGTSVADNFPGILTGVSYTSVAAGGATGNTAAGSGNISDTLNMPAGSSVTYTVNASILPSATGSLSNTATVTAGAGVTDPTPGNNSATDTDTLTPSADVAVDKTGDASVTPGDNITYTITVTNSGPSDAVSLSLSDAVPTNTTFVSVTTPAGWTRTDAVPAGGTGTLTFTRGSFAAGDTPSVFTLVVTANLGLPDGTVITNTANVSSTTADPNAANNTDSATTTVQNNADLSITKNVSPTGPNAAGSSVTYTIVVTNNGPSASANNVTFSDGVPAGLTVTSQTNPSGWSCNSVVGGNGTITCTKATVAKDETATLTVVATIGCNVANGATISNSATVSAASPADGDTSNNTANASFTVTNSAPVLSASIGTNQLPQNTHELLNVGLTASATDGPCGAPTVTVQVYGDEDDQTPTAKNEVFSPDAKDIGPNGTLRLRAERVNTGDGRVYLIVVKATDGAGQTSFQTFTVVVPKSSSSKDMQSVFNQAAAAKSFADTHNGAAPAGYFVIGDGPIIGNKQ